MYFVDLEGHEVKDDDDDLVIIRTNMRDAIYDYLEDFSDDVLDVQIYHNDRGDHCAVVAYQPDDVVTGVVLLIEPRPEIDEHTYKMTVTYEKDSPVTDVCPQRILDLLSKTKNRNAKAWRARCRKTLLQEECPGDQAAADGVPGRWERGAIGSPDAELRDQPSSPGL